MKQVRRTSLSEQVLESILDYIQENHLSIGDKLPTEEELTERLNVSRTSVREAMKGLSINGVVESIAGKGTFLRSPVSDIMMYNHTARASMASAKATVEEVMEIRTALELLVGELAIKRGTDEEIASLEQSLHDLQEVVASGKGWATAGTHFHIQLARMSHNQLLLETISSLTSTFTKYKNEMFKYQTNMERSISEHIAILDAVKDRDQAAMRKAMKNHMSHTRQEILKLVDASNAEEFL